MHITFTLEGFDIFTLEVKESQTLEQVKVLIENQIGVPADQQQLLLNGNILPNHKLSVKECGLTDGEVILIRKLSNQSRTKLVAVAEEFREKLLTSPRLQNRISQQYPDLLEAARDRRSQKFYRLFEDFLRKSGWSDEERPPEHPEISLDPESVEAQKRIEQQIHEENIAQNMDLAMEVVPEAFAEIFMLYIHCEVNGIKAQAFVDSGAQVTIMDADFAKKCGLVRLMDTNWAGIAMGVGTAKIIGRVHMAHLKIEGTLFPCSFTIMEGQPMDILFGLDMLRRHQCAIDLGRNVLTMDKLETRFLHEREIIRGFGGPSPPEAQAAATTTTAAAPTATAAAGTGTGEPTQREEHIQSLVNLGVTRGEAIAALNATGGRVEAAVEILFADSQGH